MGKRNKDFEEVNTLTIYKLMLVGPICKKLKTDKINLSKLNSQQIRTFVIREWEALKDRLKKKQNKIELSEEQERRIINWFTRKLRKLKKRTRKEQKELSQRPGSLLYSILYSILYLIIFRIDVIVAIVKLYLK